MKTITVRIYNIVWKGELVEGCDWYCDNCNALLNIQSGFSFHQGTFCCERCGHENDIDEDNIIDIGLPSEDYADFDCDECYLDSEIESYLEYKYGQDVRDFDFDITNIDYDDEDEDPGSEFEDDYNLADFCRGEDLSEED